MHYLHIGDRRRIVYLKGQFSTSDRCPMKVLLVFAHPEPRSLNGALRDVAIKELEAQGHEVRVSDLYADGWKSEVDRADFPSLAPDVRFVPVAASKKAFDANTLTDDVKAEIEKLLWADTLILQFPLWWFAMPAILKGWVDRVFAYGFAYGVGEHSDQRWGDRYGEGTLAGKRAMLIVTAGGWEEHYAARGVNGQIDELLFPINHGILYYPGYDVLPPFVLYRVDRFDEAGFEDADARDHAAHPLSAAEWRRLSDPEHATPPRPGRSGCDRLHASSERRRRGRLA
jgi:NAD(P)H dehydrogenase (quinone)